MWSYYGPLQIVIELTTPRQVVALKSDLGAVVLFFMPELVLSTIDFVSCHECLDETAAMVASLLLLRVLYKLAL